MFSPAARSRGPICLLLHVVSRGHSRAVYPKGGIRPHSRFSIKAKRSEVLFVDYIAEHLNPSGRAGVIVPEGIIFQSQNAYKALRKMLVENYLWAVVSLPAGIFNPYSGVKTSILFIDKSLAKRTDKILFVKIENDGFDLGAQRRPIDKNDLPAAEKFLNIYKSKAPRHSTVSPQVYPGGYSPFAHVVTKQEIAKTADFNLTGDRYITLEHHKPGHWPMVELGEACQIKPPKSELNGCDQTMLVSFVPMSDLNETQIHFTPKQEKQIKEVFTGYTYFKNNDVLLAKITPCFENGKSGIARNLKNGIGFGSTEFFVLRTSKNILPEWIYYHISTKTFLKLGTNNMTGSAGQQRVTKDFISSYQISLPSIKEQKQIVAEIEAEQKIVSENKKLIEIFSKKISDTISSLRN